MYVFQIGEMAYNKRPIKEVTFIGKFQVNEKNDFGFKTNYHTSLEEDI